MSGKKPVNKKKSIDTEVIDKEVQVDDTPIIPKDVDPNTIVTVKNGFQGKLVYISPRTHERFIWNEFGDEQEMELRELRNAKSSAKVFYENNWFMFDDENSWIISYLGLGKYYKHAIKLEDFDDIFEMTPSKIKDTVKELSAGQKKSLSYRSRQLVSDGEIDSRKVITALEEALDTQLIER